MSDYKMGPAEARFANSVLGARCNRNSGIMDIMGSVLGYVPYFGLLTDEGRKLCFILSNSASFFFFSSS